jgi:hypothetical protein
MQDRATGHAWGFSLCHCTLRLLDCVRWHEVFRARETSGSIHTARTQIKQKLKTALLYFGAAVLSNSHWSPEVCSRNGACLVWLAASLFEQHSLTRKIFGWCGATAVPREKRIPMHIIYSLVRLGSRSRLELSRYSTHSPLLTPLLVSHSRLWLLSCSTATASGSC